jgi:2-haloacid dehalogenase
MYLLTRPLYPFFDELDGVFISGEVGVAKPDPAIFGLFLERFGLTAEEIVFIDDSPANVAAARALGIESIRFDDAAQARRELVRLGFPLAPQP